MAALVNAALFAGLTLAIGAVSTRFLILGRSDLAIAERTPAARHAAAGGTLGAALVLVAAVARASIQVSSLSEPGDDRVEMFRLVLGSTSTGRYLVLQAIWSAVAVLAFASARRERERGWRAALLAVSVLAFSGATHVLMTLHAPVDLIVTSWGRLFGLKLALVALTLALGYRHWRGAESQVRAGGRAAFSASLARELGIALIVISLTGLLTVTATPD